MKFVESFAIISIQQFIVWGDTMGKLKEKAIDKSKAICEVESKHNIEKTLELAKQRVTSLNKWLTAASSIGPVCISLLYLFLTIDFSNFVLWHLLVDVAATLLVIGVLLVWIYKLDIAQCVVNRIETDKEDRQKRIEKLEERIKLLDDDKSFYASATLLIGEAMKAGQQDIESLAKVLCAAIYHNLSMVTTGDNITINLYELRNGWVKMLLSATRLKHCEKSSVNSPMLYKSNSGLSINDPRIQGYYCIKCLKGKKVKGKDGKYAVSSWEELARNFKWSGWNATEKEEIIKSHDRQRCIEQGFKYNQYFAFKIKRDDGVTGFFEIITNEHTLLATTSEFDHVTHRLRDTYLPLINVLWDISK